MCLKGEIEEIGMCTRSNLGTKVLQTAAGIPDECRGPCGKVGDVLQRNWYARSALCILVGVDPKEENDERRMV